MLHSLPISCTSTMLNPPKKLCITCKKNTPHPTRKKCIDCIMKEKRNREREQKQKIEKKKVERKAKVTQKLRFSRTNLVKEADRAFSIYVRNRDQWLPCITCETSWEDNFQCWHFMSRRHLNTRWVKTNAHGQCPKCNLWGSWEQFAHAEAIDKLYWQGMAKIVQKLALNTEKTTDEEILDYIRTYYQLLEDMGVEFKPKKYYIA